MKELEEIDEKKAKQMVEKLEGLMVSRQEMHKLKESALKLKEVPMKGKIFTQSEKLKHKIEELKVPTLEALEDE